MTAPGTATPHDLDAFAGRIVFCLWTGPEIMSDARLRALWTIFRNTGCGVAFITRETVGDWVKPDFPLHPAWPYLSSTHKADYLRCYLMHHYGGGYTDIKSTSKRWGPFFDQLAASDKLALGYQELAHGIPHITGEFGDLLRRSHQELIGLCAFIFRKGTPLTAAWLARTEALLDQKLEALRRHPAIHPLDQTGVLLPNGQPSPYPLRWAELLGEIFHPLTYEQRHQLLLSPIDPSFASYR
ncbi:glycosyltransferase family 32 protein [Nitrospirillum bahiense]|uniref:Glycosyl transferase-like sugar-binding protein n=1 Tax=Nitrospirillum amazonense TaxID=28077 RepID=A0A560G6Q8_9PROT|nr:hypothetical protein [Nitrospirillum amazonense]TWB29585.1 hypothetical protein FBZ88_1037 [Nitrospirillum amazonense]